MRELVRRSDERPRSTEGAAVVIEKRAV